MTEFQNFLPSFWVDNDGLLIPAQPIRQSSEKQSAKRSPRSWAVALSASIVAMSFVTGDILLSDRTSAISFAPNSKAREQFAREAVPTDYFTHLSRTIKLVPRLPDSDGGENIPAYF